MPTLQVIYEEKSQIAPGLSQTFQLVYTPKEKCEFLDHFYILTENFKKEVKVAVFPPAAFFNFEEKLDFGFLEEGSTATKEITISNDGSEKGQITLVSSEKYLVIDQNNIFINPGEKYTV